MTVLALEVGQTDGRVWTQQGGMLGVWALPPSSVCLSICYLFTSGEGNGNPLQYSCLENPMDGGAWWVTSIYLSLNFLWSAYVSVYASLHLWSVNHPSLIGLPLICLSVCLPIFKAVPVIHHLPVSVYFLPGSLSFVSLCTWQVTRDVFFPGLWSVSPDLTFRLREEDAPGLPCWRKG